MADRYCTNYGHELSEDGRFCPNCGSPVHQTAQVPTPEADIPVPLPPQQRIWATATPPQQANALPWQRSMATKLAIGAAKVFVVLVLLGVVIVAEGVAGSGSKVSIPSFRATQQRARSCKN